MIQFKEWHLTWDGAPVAMQFDSGSVPLEIRGELPEGYDWEAVSYTHLTLPTILRV